MPPQATDLLQALQQIVKGAAAMPGITLRPGQRMALSGRLFREGPLLVTDTAAALAEEPAIFTDVPIDPAGLAAQQERATAYLLLHRGLLSLAQQAADWFLVEQTGGIDLAMSAI